MKVLASGNQLVEYIANNFGKGLKIIMNLIKTWVVNTHWKKIFLIISSSLCLSGIGLITYGTYLESQVRELTDKLWALKGEIPENFSILYQVEDDFNKFKNIDLSESTNIPEWLTQYYLTERYIWQFDLDSNEQSSCNELRKITQGKIVCQSLKEIELYIQLITELEPNVFESSAVQKFKPKQVEIDKLDQELENKDPYGAYTWGTLVTIIGGVILLPTGILYGAGFINDSRKSQNQLNKNLDEAQQDLSLSQSPWKNASRVLDAYYQRNLGQIRKIYITSISVMITGFIVILVSIGAGIIITSREQPSEKLQEDIMEILKANNNLEKLSKDQLEILLNPPGSAALIISVIGTGSGIITSFIGATFLYLYQITLRQSSEYTAALAKTNTVGIAMEILSTIDTKESIEKVIEAEYFEKEEEKEIDQTIEIAKIEIAKLLIQQLQNLDRDIQKK